MIFYLKLCFEAGPNYFVEFHITGIHGDYSEIYYATPNNSHEKQTHKPSLTPANK